MKSKQRMESIKHMRSEELSETTDMGGRKAAIDLSQFVGSWMTANSKTRGIVRINVTTDDDELKVHAFGACSPSPCDWGQTSGTVFSDGINSTKGLAFSAVYDFGFMETHLQAKVKKGVLVVASFNKFKDDSGRSNYFSREFFYQ
ncbi:MAG: hypothetical protein ACRD4L_06755 [Pyrinomonadaceae bacterium]